MELPTMIDLFAGCGGVTLGFKNAGFAVLAAVEKDPAVAETYRLNHPEVLLCEDDIREVHPREMMERCGLRAGELTVLSVCAPCQPFSRHNRSGKRDSSAYLILEASRFVAEMKPWFVFLENVPDLGKNAHKEIIDRFVADLEDEGYAVLPPRIVDAVDYGVPQFRKRLIMLAGSTKELPTFPEPTHASPTVAARTGKIPWRTVADAISDLPPLRAGEQDANDPLHKARRHTALALERLRHIPHNGGSRNSLPFSLQLACHRNGKAGYRDVYGRMDYGRPSNTLTTGCTNFTKGRFAHPEQDRAITPREAARLQTFPDTYRFHGTYGQVSAQIGNAVPVMLAEAFAAMFYRLWERIKHPRAALATA
ncbi:MAG: DNA cytosine methyltransferase [Moorellales bacterium]